MVPSKVISIFLIDHCSLYTEETWLKPKEKNLSLCNSNNMDPFKLIIINHWLWINNSFIMKKLQYLTIPNNSADFLLSLLILDSEDQLF